MEMNILSNSIIIRDHRIPSRCFLAPINTGYAEGGNPTKRLMNFHSIRSGKGIGISFVGTTAIFKDGVPNGKTLILNDKSYLDSFRTLSACIRNHGSLPGIQLGCRLTKITPTKTWQSRNVREIIKNIREEISSYSEDTFIKISKKFYQSIALAVETGFEVIQLHAAHGYFLSLLLSPIFNARKDEFGLPTCRLLFDIIEKTKQSYPNIILGIRINCIYGLENKNKELENTICIVARLFEAGVDIVDLSAGVYDINKYLIYPSIPGGHVCYLPYALKVRREISNNLGIISFSGNVWDLSKVDQSLEDNMGVSIGRSLITDPDFVLKYFDKRTEKIISCIRKKTCPCHYFSNGRSSIECSENKNLGQEIDL
jgi:2,4-dienoyl-CoA reductase-like NADH-dependent reductase (Old Yellow Enzyme family)